jgi:WD40 repeat protein
MIRQICALICIGLCSELTAQDGPAQLVFKNQFEKDEEGWTRTFGDDFTAQKTGTGYMLMNKTEDRHVVAKVVEEFERDEDFTMSADLWHTEGVDNRGYGLIWFDGTYEYNFLISDNGYYYVGIKDQSGNWITINDWEQDSHIKNENSSNTIYVKKRGKGITFYINGFIAASTGVTEERSWSPMQIVGLAVYGKQEVIVEEISLTKNISLPHPDYMEIEIQGPDQGIENINFDRNTLVIAAADKSITEFDLSNSKVNSRKVSSLGGYTQSSDGSLEFIISSMDTEGEARSIKTGDILFSIKTKDKRYACAGFSNDNRLLAVGSYDNTAKVFSVPDGKELKTLKGFTDLVGEVLFTPDNKFLITSSFENIIRIWDVATFKLANQLNASGQVSRMSVTPDGRYLAAACLNSQVNVFDLTTNTLVNTIHLTNDVFGVGMTPDGKKVIAAANDNMVTISDVVTGRVLRKFADGGMYAKLDVSDDGKYFAYSTKEAGVALVDVTTGKRIKTFAHKKTVVRKPRIATDFFAHAADIMDIEVIEDGKTFVSVSKDKTARIWDLTSSQNTKTLIGQTGDGLNGMLYRTAVSPDKSQILVGGFLAKDGSNAIGDIRAFNAVSGNISGVIKRHTNVILDLCFSKDGSRFASADFHMLRIWDDKALARDLAGTEVAKNEIRVRALKFEDEISSISLSPDGKKLAMSSVTNKDLYIADISSFDDKGNPISFKWYPKHEKNILVVRFTPDGNILSAGPENAVLWNSAGDVLKEFKDLRVPREAAIDFSADGKLAIVAHQILDLTNGTVLAKAPHTGNTTASAFVGKDMVATAKDNIIYIWNARTGKEIKQLAPLSESIRQVAFVDNGLTLALSPAPGMAVNANELTADQIVATFDFKTLRYEKYTGKMGAKNNLTDNKNGVKISYTEQNGETNLSVLNFGSNKLNGDGARGVSRAFTLLSDGTALVGFMNTLSQFNTAGKEIKRFEGHNGLILSLAISADGRYFASFAEDNTVRLWNFEDAGQTREGISFVQPRATLVVSKAGEWVCFTPQNFYASSKNGGKYVNFTFNNGRSNAAKQYSFDQFDLKFNRPDLLLETIGASDEKYRHAYKKAYDKRLAKYGLLEVDQYSFDLPVITMTNVSKSIAGLEEVVEFSCVATQPIMSIHVSVNGVPIYGKQGIAAADSALFSLSRKLPVKLTSGKNVIQVWVMDETGNESLKESVTITSTAPAVKGDLYLVAIGVSNYSDATYNLTYAAKDAQDLSKLYESKKANFKNINIISLTDAQGTRDNILKVRETLIKSNENDEVIIFFAGHGVLDNQLDYYFATHDLDFNDPSSRGLRYEALENLLDGIGARKKLMLIDACHSGEIDKDETTLIASATKAPNVKSRGFKNAESKNTGLENSFELMQHLFADIRKGTGAAVIASASGVEFAYESPEWKNGVFTFAVLEGLRAPAKTDKNKNTTIEVSELRDYVSTRVTELTSGKQHPTTRKENLEFDFSVW